MPPGSIYLSLSARRDDVAILFRLSSEISYRHPWASLPGHQQVSTDQIRETRAVFEAIVHGYRSAWFKVGSSEEIAQLLIRSTVLNRDAQQAGL
jgi:hypothetical protein